eukprot:3036904-Alexandrium_andersonii.AAC.1
MTPPCTAPPCILASARPMREMCSRLAAPSASIEPDVCPPSVCRATTLRGPAPFLVPCAVRLRPPGGVLERARESGPP